MREIKFRAWEKDKKEMSYFGLGHGDMYAWGYELLNGYDLMQFTGLKDKNGKEIYEGDILSMFSGTQKSEVYWSEDGMWEVVAQLSGGSLSQGQLLSNMLDIGEVIGNIYENPELLTNQ